MQTSSEETQTLANLRVPPHSIEAECSLLGAILLNNDAHGLVAGLINASDFYRYENQLVYKTAEALIEIGKPADVITVYEELKGIGKARLPGAASYLNSLPQYFDSQKKWAREV